MQLYLAQKIASLKLDARAFFRLAHIDIFKRDVDVTTDAIIYNETGKIPKYVELYILNIQRKESGNVMPTV